MKRRLTFAGALVIMTSLIVGACSQGASSQDSEGSAASTESKGTIAFTHPISTAPVTQAVIRYAEARAAELGYTLVTDAPNGDAAKQAADIDTWIVQGVDAIVVFPGDASTVASAQERAQAAGIKWISYGGPQDGEDGAVNFSHSDSGQLVGENAVSWINAQSEAQQVLILDAATTLPSIKDRWEIPISLITEQTDATIVAEQEALDQATGLEVTENVLAANPELRVVIGTNDDGALGALQAFKNAGISADEVYIAGQDGTTEALEAVLAGGSYRASAVVHVSAVGAAVVDAAVAAVTGEGETSIDVKPALATQDDTAKTEEYLAELQG